ncbi:uncharacterized protein LOC130453158 [Diorhabda sublineata]|uniref:uncharacterized protein LOC130453158 n=1 Tax=Diorhabda sublineata TaxID=1163346 RepID=UPI0024E12619|nr:uncharacterized protein LOC130453158 [Diorhabda sublineata]
MERNNEESTVQRRDTSVPVESGGERVGPPRPSTSDHYAPAVGDQAGVLDMVTGMEIDPFARRSSLARSPPGRRGSVPNLSTDDDTGWTSNIQQLAKRKRLENISIVDIAMSQSRKTIDPGTKILRIIDSLVLETKALVKTARESTNTKKEIREISMKLLRLTEQLTTREAQDTLKRAVDSPDKPKPQDEKTVKINTREVGTQANERPVTCSSTQTDGPEKLTPHEIDTHLTKGLNEESLKNLIGMKWRNECFQKTKKITENMRRVLDGRDLAIFMDTEKAAENKIVQEVAVRIPHIWKLVEANKIQPGKVISVASNSKFWMEDEGETEVVNFTFFVGLPNEQDKEQDLFQLYMACKGLTEATRHKGVKHITVVPSKEWDEDQALKVLECACRENNVEAVICMQSNNKGQTRAQSRKQGEAVIIDVGDRTYADLLKEVKKEVQEKGLSDSVGGVRMTKSGNLLLKMEETAGGAERLVEALRGRNGVKALRGVQKAEVVLHIKNIDAVTNKQEVEAAIRDIDKGRKPTGDIRVSSLRPDYGGTQAATLFIPKETADSLLKMGKIRIGLVNCSVRERVRVDSCHRCWEIGHIAKFCKGPDRTRLCIQCGGDNHQKKDCTKEAHCVLCNISGHRPLSLKCPLYRGEIKRLRTNRQQNVQTSSN